MPPANPGKVAALTRKAHRLHQQGKLDKAETMFKKALKQQPGNFDALQSLGAIALHRQAYARAIELLEKALAVQPDVPGLLNNLALAYKESGQREKARNCFQRVVALDSSFGPAYFNLALLLMDDGAPEAALHALQQAERCRPGHVPTLTQLAHTLTQLGRAGEAIEYFRVALRLQPGDPQLQFDLGNAYIANRQPGDAETAFRAAIDSDPDMHAARAKLADVLESLHRTQQAREQLDALLAARPDHPLGNLVLARIERQAGELDSAAQRLQRVLDSDDGRAADDDIRAGIFTELGTVLDRQQQFAPAFQAFTRANRIMAGLPSTRAIDRQRALHAVDAGLAWIASKTADRRPVSPSIDDGLPDPLFLVGFPRSGTTLTEQILATHERVHSSDEQPVLDDMTNGMPAILGREFSYPADIDRLDTDEICTLRAHYWKKMTEALGDHILNGRFIDKLPLNIIHLGLIERLFPHTRVIVALRDPRDVCLSCYMQLFHVNETMVQFLDIADSARYYAAVMKLWLAYRDRLGIRWMESRYEDIVSDFDASADELNAFLGLETPEDLQDFHRRAAGRAISTPSYHDVSTPIYRRAMGRWQHYREPLEPALAELAPYLRAFGYAP